MHRIPKVGERVKLHPDYVKYHPNANPEKTGQVCHVSYYTADQWRVRILWQDGHEYDVLHGNLQPAAS